MTVYHSLHEANAARQIEWDADNQITLAYRGNELAGEVGEACNVIKKLERERLGIRGSRDTVEHLAEELADIEICNGLIAMQAGIDLDAAVVEKFNATSEKMGLETRLALRVPAPTPSHSDIAYVLGLFHRNACHPDAMPSEIALAVAQIRALFFTPRQSTAMSAEPVAYLWDFRHPSGLVTPLLAESDDLAAYPVYRAALSSAPVAPAAPVAETRMPDREAVARTLADELWCGATFDDGTDSEREAFLNAADAILALFVSCHDRGGAA